LLENKFSLLRYKDKVLIFANNYDQFDHFKFKFKKFLCIKGLKINKINYLSCSIFNPFYFVYWKFQKLDDRKFIFQTSNTIIRNYKCKLKIFIKNSQNISILQFLKQINFFILKWRAENNYCTLFLIQAAELDIYLYRLLWKWAKRRHPRRSNSWIYSKYWKSFGGIWKFFTVDANNGNLAFLKSHFAFQTKRLYSLPRSFKVFDLDNYQKLNFIWFNKLRLNFHTLYRSLWNRQKGVCFRCFKSISYFDFNNIKIFKSSKFLKIIINPFSQLVLIHVNCLL
jgi:RNA-directed DNA polymerase